MPKWFSRFLLLFLIWPSMGTVWGQEVSSDAARLEKDIQVRFLYPAGTFYRYDSAFPLIIEYQNVSANPRPFELNWDSMPTVPKSYRRMILEPGAKKRLPLLFPPGTIDSLYGVTVNQELINLNLSSGNSIHATGLLVSGNDTLDYIKSLQIQQNPYYDASAEQQEDQYLTFQTLSDLDESIFPEHWAGLQPLNYLICYDLPSQTLSKRQYQAIVDWVRQGGQLVLLSNGVPGEFKGTPLEALLPLQPSGQTTTGERISVTGSPHPEARVNFEFKNQPICWERDVQRGRVWFINTPLLSTDTLGKTQTELLWRTIFTPQLATFRGNSRFEIFHQAILGSLPELPAAQSGWIALFVLVYGVIVGPVNLTILRKKDKMLWSFVTVPAVALLFALGAYLANNVVRPSAPIVREIGWLRLQNHQQLGRAESEALLYNPHPTVYKILCHPSAVVSLGLQNHRGSYGDRELSLLEPSSEGGLQASFKMGTWDVQRFNILSTQTLEKPIHIAMREENKIVIDSPIASDGESAMVWLKERGYSQTFVLTSGKSEYTLRFPANAYPSGVLDFDEKTHPGRNLVLDTFDSNHGLGNPEATEENHLLFWSSQLKSPFHFDPNTEQVADYLVSVDFKL